MGEEETGAHTRLLNPRDPTEPSHGNVWGGGNVTRNAGITSVSSHETSLVSAGR